MRLALTLALGMFQAVVVPPPTISSVSPNTGVAAGGTAITITGTGFITGATVTVGGNAATSITVVSSTSITCTTAAHAAGATDVVVTCTSGSVTSTGAFTFLALPTISSVSPNVGTTAGGTSITITGTGFITGETVTVGGVSATSVTHVSSTSVTCTTGAHAAGAVDVVLTCSAGSATSTGGFTYQTPVFDPATLSLTGWVRGNYGGSPWAGVASAGNSGSHSFSEGTNPPTTGTALNSKVPAHFDGSNDLLDGGSDGSIYLSQTAYSMVFLAKLSSPAAADTVYGDPQLVADSGAYIGVGWNTSGVRAWHYDGTYSGTGHSTCSASAWHMIAITYNGTTLSISVDGGTPVTAAKGSVTRLDYLFRLGQNYASVFTSMDVEEFMSAQSAFSGTNLTNIKSYFNATYGLSL